MFYKASIYIADILEQQNKFTADDKELYRYEGENHITSYAEYENGYKVIGLSNSTDKYTVLDKDNKNLYSSKKVVLILDSELVLGDKPSYSAILYSSKDNKVINEIVKKKLS